MNTPPTHARFRVHTVSYYDVQLDKLEKHYHTDDVVEAAQIDQSNFRMSSSDLLGHLQDTEAEVYVQVFDPGGQMFSDEFIQEVIGILRMDDLQLNIDHSALNRDKTVHAQLTGEDGRGRKIELDGFGRSMGFALRDIREQLRQTVGR